MKIYLCRHGETDHNKNGIIMGHLPIPLNTKGKKQSKNLAKELENKGIEIIFSSDLKRAKETTEIINSVLNVPIIYYEKLREHSLGKYDGMKIGELHEILENLDKFDSLMTQIGGEITGEFVNRVWSIFKEIAKSNEDKENILIITHGGCIRSVVAKILEASEIVFDNLKQDNCCINVISCYTKDYDSYNKKDDKEHFLIETLNSICHLR